MYEDVFIVDTTLRDGEQCPGKVFSAIEKITIAKNLEKMGVYQIEAGIPAMGENERDIIKEILKNRENCFISTWNRIVKEDIMESIKCNPDIIHLSVPTSNIHIYSKLNKDRNWLENTMLNCVYFAREHNFDVTIGFEDASRTEIDYLLKLCETLEKLGVSGIRYADTVGISTPSTIKAAIKAIRKNTNMDIEIHAHNDFGMAIANSLEAIKAGARFVNCTLEGIGERAGNCNFEEFTQILKSYK